MTDWKHPRGRDRTKLALIIGAGVVFAAIAWLLLARPGEEKISSSGFNSGGLFLAPPMSGGAFSKHSSQTGLSFVRIGDAAGGVGAASRADGALAEAQAQAAAPSAYAISASPVPAPAPSAESDKSEMEQAKALGVPTDASGLNHLALKNRMLSGLITKLVGYPSVVKFLLNNKVVNDALFMSEPGRTNCQSAAALTSFMTNRASLSEPVSIIKVMLAHPDVAEVAVDSEYGRRVMACPSVAQLKENPAPLAQVVIANPELLGIITDPAAVNAVSSNPQASALMTSAQSSLGIGGGQAQ